MAEEALTTGFTFAWPWLLLLAPVPWLLRLLLPASPSGDLLALRVPWFSAVAGGKAGWMRRPWLALVAALIWLLLLFAASRPQWIGEIESLPVSGRDLLLAVDISGSMDTQDMILNKTAVNRLKVVKKVAGEFIKRRHGDRVGLILFGSRAYLQTPLTFDRQTVHRLLNESATRLAGRNTAIGDAIGLAIKQLRKQEDRQQVLILMTDGTNTAGRVGPLEAAKMAAQEKLKIYTVGIGAAPRTRRGLLGMRSAGRSDLDEKTLKAIAKETGGQYFRAHNTREFARIYEELDRLEPVEKEMESYRPRHDLFQWPLLLFMLFSAVTLWLRRSR